MKQIKSKFDNVEYTVNYITKYNEAMIAAAKLKASPIQNWGLDIETGKLPQFKDHKQSGLDPHQSFIRLVQLYDGKKTIYVFDALHIRSTCPFDPNSKGLEFFKDLEDKNYVAHNGVFEIKHFTHNGYRDLKIGCSMLISILIDRAERSPMEPDEEEEDEERPDTYKGYGLDAMVGKLFNVRMEKKYQTSNWNDPKLSNEQLVYAALDAVYTYKIAEALIPKINQYKMVKAYRLLKDMQHVIADMEYHGMQICPKRHAALMEQWSEEEVKAMKECANYFGSTNLKSSKQLEKWALEKYEQPVLDRWITTPKGSLSFKKDNLAPLQHLPEIAALIRYKKVVKLISTYGESLKAHVRPGSVRVHTSFTLGATRTGRLSSREPNLQNLPRDDEKWKMRNIFVPAKGNVLIVADFNQIELRVAGELSRDPVILMAYANGEDLHIVFASKGIYQIKAEKVTKDQRQIAKSANFGALFGMGPDKFVGYVLTNTGKLITREFAKEVLDGQRSLYIGYTNFANKSRLEAETFGFVRTPLGKMRKLCSNECYTKAPNSKVQGGAFEVMGLSMVELRKRLPRRMYLVNSVHDELIVECPNNKDDIQECKQHIEASMIHGMLTIFPKATTRGLAVAHEGDSWGAAKK